MPISTSDWHAWNDLQPPAPFHFHVTGEIEVGNPGILATLYPKKPQGVNSTILLLDLHLFQRPGNWNQIVTKTLARYDSLMPEPKYVQVEIFSGTDSIEKIDVEDIH